MLTATKKLTRVGSYSKGVVIPREWLDATGATMYNLEYDERTHNITMIPVNAQRRTQNHIQNSVNASNDYTPQPRQVYPASPHPAFTPAKWASLDPWYADYCMSLLKEAEEEGFTINNKSDFTRFEQQRSDKLNSRFTTPPPQARPMLGFNDIPQPMLEHYWQYIAPCVGDYKGKTDLHNARGDWAKAIHKCLDIDSVEGKADFINAATKAIIHKYDDDLDEL